MSIARLGGIDDLVFDDRLYAIGDDRVVRTSPHQWRERSGR
jgi:hypothetical protein